MYVQCLSVALHMIVQYSSMQHMYRKDVSEICGNQFAKHTLQYIVLWETMSSGDRTKNVIARSISCPAYSSRHVIQWMLHFQWYIKVQDITCIFYREVGQSGILHLWYTCEKPFPRNIQVIYRSA